MTHRRTRVVHVVNSLALGGAERFLVELVTHLDRSRFENTVYCIHRPGEMAERLRTLGERVEVISVGRRLNLRGVRILSRSLRDMRPDIVHSHLPESTWYAMPAAWLAGVPIRIAHLQNCHWTMPLRLRVVDWASSKFMSHSLACSLAVKEFHVRRQLYPESKVQVVPNGVDLSRFENRPSRAGIRETLKIDPDTPVALCVASLTPQKGHVDLLEGFARAAEVTPSLILLLVGDGRLRSQLEARAIELGISESVRFLGQRHDVPELMIAADVFVLCSMWEGMGLVFAEASVAGLPCIGTRVDGIPEVVVDGQTGILVPARSPSSVADALTLLLRDSELRRHMGTNAAERARVLYDMKAIAAKVESIYASALAQGGWSQGGSAR